MVKRTLIALKLGRGNKEYYILYLDKSQIANKSFFKLYIFLYFLHLVKTADFLGAATFGVLQHLGIYIKFETFVNLWI
jgi:hypothetical protein